MERKKAIVCTIIFAILIIIVGITMFLVKPYNSEISLFYIFSPAIVGLWCGERIEKFYKWLIKKED